MRLQMAFAIVSDPIGLRSFVYLTRGIFNADTKHYQQIVVLAWYSN